MFEFLKFWILIHISQLEYSPEPGVQMANRGRKCLNTRERKDGFTDGTMLVWNDYERNNFRYQKEEMVVVSDFLDQKCFFCI